MGDSPIPSESGFGSPASEVSLEESDVPIIVWDTEKGLIVNGLVQRIGPCIWRRIPSESGAGSESGFGSPASESGFGNPVSLE